MNPFTHNIKTQLGGGISFQGGVMGSYISPSWGIKSPYSISKHLSKRG